MSILKWKLYSSTPELQIWTKSIERDLLNSKYFVQLNRKYQKYTVEPENHCILSIFHEKGRREFNSLDFKFLPFFSLCVIRSMLLKISYISKETQQMFVVFKNKNALMCIFFQCTLQIFLYKPWPWFLKSKCTESNISNKSRLCYLFYTIIELNCSTFI